MCYRIAVHIRHCPMYDNNLFISWPSSSYTNGYLTCSYVGNQFNTRTKLSSQKNSTKMTYMLFQFADNYTIRLRDSSPIKVVLKIDFPNSLKNYILLLRSTLSFSCSKWDVFVWCFPSSFSEVFLCVKTDCCSLLLVYRKIASQHFRWLLFIERTKKFSLIMSFRLLQVELIQFYINCDTIFMMIANVIYI